MSSDARIRMGANGWSWFGDHDGPCEDGFDPLDHASSTSLSEKIHELETCLGGPLRWEVDDHWTDGTVRLRGWSA